LADKEDGEMERPVTHDREDEEVVDPAERSIGFEFDLGMLE
jgi:hypothetical protein